MIKHGHRRERATIAFWKNMRIEMRGRNERWRKERKRGSRRGERCAG